jgi:hypothetical protein
MNPLLDDGILKIVFNYIQQASAVSQGGHFLYLAPVCKQWYATITFCVTSLWSEMLWNSQRYLSEFHAMRDAELEGLAGLLPSRHQHGCKWLMLVA